jgi:hypothetical protein
MTVLTFDEWCEQNQDLVEECRAWNHPCGLTYGHLADIGAEGAAGIIRAELLRLYEEQRKKDTENLAAWNKAVQEEVTVRPDR